MRIALTVPGGVDRSGEHHVIPAFLWFIERLARQHDVHVVVARQESHAGSWDLFGAVVHNVTAWPRQLSAVALLARLHRSRPFDVFHGLSASGPGAVACAAARMCQRPVVVHVTGGELVWKPDIRFGPQSPMSRAMSRAVVQHADRVTGASTSMIELITAAGAVPVRVTLGVDTRRWTPLCPRPRPLNRPARLVSVGSLTPVKDHATLLRAVAALASRGCVCDVDLVGEDVSLGVIPQLVHALGLADRVRFHGVVTQTRLLPLVSAADVMVIPSRHEAGPVAFLEAAAVGVPSVGTAVGHLRDLAPAGAVVVDMGDAESLAREIEHLLAHDARRLAIAAHAQRFALSEDADWTCARFEGLYAELITASAEGRGTTRGQVLGG